jgi:large subunit ribosomal protein L10
MPNAARTHKAAVVDEVRARINDATASIVSEYRGLTVAELAELRASLAAVGGDYKVFKNTLVKRAIDGGEHQPLADYLSGPTALTFVDGDVSAVAKALRDFARGNPHLVVKGGLADGSLLSPSDLATLADLPSRDVLLARIAGALAAPMQQLAALLQALPQNLAYGISALIEQREASGEKIPEPEAEAPPGPAAEAEAVVEAVVEAEAPPEPEAEAVVEAPVDAGEEPAAEAPPEPEPEAPVGAEVAE